MPEQPKHEDDLSATSVTLSRREEASDANGTGALNSRHEDE